MKKIGLVVALAEEQAQLYNSLGGVVGEEFYGSIKVTEFKRGDCSVFLADSGVGEIHAALSTELLILKYGVEVVINFGVVGSLSSKYRCKDVVLVNEVVHYDFSPQLSDPNAFGKYLFQRDDFVFGLDNAFIDKVRAVIGDYPLVRIVTGDKFIDVSSMKNWLIEHFAGEICDMESAGIYFACRNFNVPCVMIKAVSDNADEEASDSFAGVIETGVTFYVEAVKKIIDAFAG